MNSALPNYVIASSRMWVPDLDRRLCSKVRGNFYTISSPEDLTLELLNRLQPVYVFFPHWSFIIPSSVFNSFKCVIFHMTDVPFGRGGSPLQNLISRGISDTKLSALLCTSEIDAGPVFLKEPLNLSGPASEIYTRAFRIIEEMIVKIIENQPTPVPQEGLPTFFRRRKPEDSNMSNLMDINSVYDTIRMLDAEGYPPAFIETSGLRLEFSQAKIMCNEVTALVRFTTKEKP